MRNWKGTFGVKHVCDEEVGQDLKIAMCGHGDRERLATDGRGRSDGGEMSNAFKLMFLTSIDRVVPPERHLPGPALHALHVSQYSQ